MQVAPMVDTMLEMIVVEDRLFVSALTPGQTTAILSKLERGLKVSKSEILQFSVHVVFIPQI